MKVKQRFMIPDVDVEEVLTASIRKELAIQAGQPCSDDHVRQCATACCDAYFANEPELDLPCQFRLILLSSDDRDGRRWEVQMTFDIAPVFYAMFSGIKRLDKLKGKSE